MTVPDGERIAALEVLGTQRSILIQELKAELKDIRSLIQAINSKLSSITYDQSITSARIEETHTIATHVSKIVDQITRDDDRQRYAISLGAKILIPVFMAVGTAAVTLYQYRLTIAEFFKRMFI